MLYLKCSCKNNVFKIRLDRIEQIALLTCSKCSKNYFLLDSGDYWLDIIQERIPRLIKCKCKNDSFKIELDYKFRIDSRDIQNIFVCTKCFKCDKQKKISDWEINYGPTNNLLKNPIIYVINPNLKYNLLTKSCYWTDGDLIKFLRFLGTETNIYFYCELWGGKGAHYTKIDLKDLANIIKKNNNYKIICSLNKLKNVGKNTIDWRKNEILVIDSPIIMVLDKEKGKLVCIYYSSNYIKNFLTGQIQEKSNKFKQLIDEIEVWFKSNYINWRGKNCFDNKKEHLRLFKNQFMK